jgi:hypothetical protein
MKKTLGAVVLAAMILVGCGGGSAAPARVGSDTTVPGDPGDKGTVPADPTSYAAQEWATFHLVELPTRFYEMEEDYAYVSYSALTGAVSSRTMDAFRSEATPVVNGMDKYLASLQPAIDLLAQAAAAGARDNDLADLAPELTMFHRAIAERVRLLRANYNAILSGDPERMGTTLEALNPDPVPQSFVCAYFNIASQSNWSTRFTPAMNESITKGTELFRCNDVGPLTGDTSA